ncbi:MAG: YqgE/AlgH family protein [Pseudomonadota bacterium]
MRGSGSSLLGGDSPFRDCLLVAMPALQADAFVRSVIYLCAHSEAGAMGIVINQRLPEVAFRDLLEQLHLPRSELRVDPVVHFGGPVETGRGFVLHSTDFLQEDTVRVNDNIGITGSVDILRAIAKGKGPHKSIFALGYAGWGPGQLDAEMHANSWLTIPADDDLIFGADLTGKWEKAILKIGVNPFALSPEMGHA